MTLLGHIILALSLCGDSFAVAASSGVSLKSSGFRQIFPVALAFSLVHIVLMAAGYFFGGAIIGFVEGFARWLSFLLLLYVGGSMIWEAFRHSEESLVNLSGLRNVIVASFAASMDALGVGISLSMKRLPLSEMGLNLTVLFIVTFATVWAGIAGGRKLGKLIGKPAEVVGGIVLILIGLKLLLQAV